MRGHRRAPGRLSGFDQLQLFLRVVLPTWSKGILLRRRAGTAMAAQFALDRGAVRFLQQLRRKHGEGPLELPSPAGPQLLLLSPDDMMQALEQTPEPFSPATSAKRAALSHFEPHVSLVTRGAKRGPRRQLSDEVLESRKPVHSLAANFIGVVRDEARRLIATSRAADKLTWSMFVASWHAGARRIVLGDAAGGDSELTAQLARLRRAANWLFLPIRKATKADYDTRLHTYLTRAQGGSLVELILRSCQSDDARPLDQITHWLFAFDAGAITTFRALALLAGHAEARARAKTDIEAWQNGRPDQPYLRACFLDTARLWPTTPVILREATTICWLGAETLAKGTGIVIYVPFFNRDNERLANADRFDPDVWLGRDPAAACPFVPFSAGPGACPGRHLVALIGAAWLAALLDAGRCELIKPKELDPLRPLPATLDHFSIRLRFSRQRRQN